MDRFEELCNRRYANAYVYLNKTIKRRKLDQTVQLIIEQENNDLCWELYLAANANPFIEDLGNFEEFKQSMKMKEENMTNKHESIIQMSDSISKASSILKRFVPPSGGE